MKEEVLKLINLDKLDFKFASKPILVSGMAMMYHELRESTKDIDLIISREDHKRLGIQLSPKAKIVDESDSEFKETPEFVDYYEDHGILIYEYEIWDSIYQFDYEFLKTDAIEEKDFLVASLEKMLIMTFIRGLRKDRYMADAKLIGEKLEKDLYKDVVPNKNEYWRKLLNS